MRNRIGLALILSAAVRPAFGLTESEANASIQFSFTSPGARSLAMGGAFLGIAADATAAYSNPAGLQALAKPEASAEYRYSRFDTPYVAGGAARLNPFDLSGVTYDSTRSHSSGLAFLSYSRPLPADTNIAFYRSELARFESAYSAGRVDLLDPGRGALRAVDSQIDLAIVNYGVSASWRASERWSLGAGLSYYTLDFDTVSTRFRTGTTEVSSRQLQRGDDGQLDFNLGVHVRLARVAQGDLTLGVVYRGGPGFDYSGVNEILLNAANEPQPRTDRIADIAFDTPDVYGAGLAWQSDAWVLSFDVLRVEYSSLSGQLSSLLTNSAEVLAPLKIDDGTEFRLGAEYTIDGKYSLRAGAWRDPAHSLRYDVPSAPDQTNLSSLAVLFSAPSDDETHYALGAGLIFEHFQIDLAADFSDAVDSYSISTVWRFD